MSICWTDSHTELELFCFFLLGPMVSCIFPVGMFSTVTPLQLLKHTIASSEVVTYCGSHSSQRALYYDCQKSHSTIALQATRVTHLTYCGSHSSQRALYYDCQKAILQATRVTHLTMPIPSAQLSDVYCCFCELFTCHHVTEGSSHRAHISSKRNLYSHWLQKSFYTGYFRPSQRYCVLCI